MGLGEGSARGGEPWRCLRIPGLEVTGPAPTLPDRLRVASPGHPRCLVTRSHLLANGFQVLVLHQVLAEVDSGEAGAAGV